jgi:hypothetical protein
MSYQSIVIGSDVIVPLRDRGNNLVRQNARYIPVLARVSRIHSDQMNIDVIDPFGVSYTFVSLRDVTAKAIAYGNQYYTNMNVRAQTLLSAYYSGQAQRYGITVERSVPNVYNPNLVTSPIALSGVQYIPVTKPDPVHNATTEVLVALRSKSGKLIKYNKHHVSITAKVVKTHSRYIHVVDDLGNSHEVPRWEVQLVLTNKSGRYFYDYNQINIDAEKIYKEYYKDRKNKKFEDGDGDDDDN